VVPVAAPGAAVDPVARRVQVSADGVVLTVRGSAWEGSPAYLDDYVTPFHLHLANGTAWPLGYGYPDLRLFDDAAMAAYRQAACWLPFFISLVQ
jgi:hypothetical protein